MVQAELPTVRRSNVLNCGWRMHALRDKSIARYAMCTEYPRSIDCEREK
jgi:hypothetical protein